MKRMLSSLLVLLFLITLIPKVQFAVGGSLFITSPKTINAKSGENVKIPITIKNTGYDDAENISITAEITDPDSVYLSDSAFDYIKYIESGDSKKADFYVDIDEMAKKGSYKIQIKINYQDLYLGPQTTEDSIYIRVDSNPPRLNISRIDILPNSKISAGQIFDIGIELENVGDTLAKEIKVTLDGLTKETFSISTGTNNQTIYSIPGGYKNYAVFKLEAAKTIKPGTYQLDLKLRYNDGLEENHSISLYVDKDEKSNSNLLIENLYYPTGSIGLNKEVNISFDLRNQGQTKAENIIIKAISSDMSGVVPKSVSQLRIPSIEPGAIETIKFEFLTTKTGETKNYPIEITVEYEDDMLSDGEKYNFNQFVGIFLVGKDENSSVPKLIIDKYNFEPSLAKAGENFTMNLSFFNTNSSKAVKNIKIFLTSNERTDSDSNSAGGSVFTPVESSNTFYIDSIPPKGRVEKKITMFTVPDAQAKTYTLTANFEYEDSSAAPYTATELIGVPVVQSSKLEIGELTYMPEAYIGQSSPIGLEFYNTGKVTLYNMMVKLEGDFQVENGQYYIGNFTSGSSENFEGYVIPNSPGELKGDVVFTYEDSTGQSQEIRKEFTLNVMEAPPMEESPDDMPPIEPSKGILSSKIFWGIIVGIVGIAGIVVYKKKKKKKLEEMEINE